MAFINATLTKFEFKSKEFSEAFKKALNIQIRKAAKEFLKAAILRVPVRTGFARGGLGNLATAIGLAAASDKTSFINKFNRRRKQGASGSRIEFYKSPGGSKVLKTPENARRYATPIDKVFKEVNNIFTFNYNITILYYNLNDFFSNAKVASAPWKSFAAGRNAFIDYLRITGIAKLPQLKQFVLKTKIKVDRTISIGASEFVETVKNVN